MIQQCPINATSNGKDAFIYTGLQRIKVTTNSVYSRDRRCGHSVNQNIQGSVTAYEHIFTDKHTARAQLSH